MEMDVIVKIIKETEEETNLRLDYNTIEKLIAINAMYKVLNKLWDVKLGWRKI